ncbi:MAG: hypothetical protein RIQ49_2511, partial [Pseudomonadota bacterium]
LSKLSGIPSPTLRAWELRYGAFKPVKTPSGQRLYARSEASRAVLIRLLADQGFSLQQLANAGLNELLSLKDSSRQGDDSFAKQTPKLKKQQTAPLRDQSREALKVLILGESLPLRLLGFSKAASRPSSNRWGSVLRSSSKRLRPSTTLMTGLALSCSKSCRCSSRIAKRYSTLKRNWAPSP